MIRRALTAVIGIAQVVIGASVIVFTYILSHNIFGIQNILNIPNEGAPLYTLLFLIFSLFTIMRIFKKMNRPVNLLGLLFFTNL